MDTLASSAGSESVPRQGDLPRYRSLLRRGRRSEVGGRGRRTGRFLLARRTPWEQLSDDEKDARLHGRW